MLQLLALAIGTADLSLPATSEAFTFEQWRQLDPTQQSSFIYGAEDCRYTWAPERFPGSNLEISKAFQDRLDSHVKSGRYPQTMDMLDVLDDLDRLHVHVTVKPDFDAEPLQYQPHGQNWGVYWTDLGTSSRQYIEGYLACRMRYFHVMPKRSVNQYRHLIDDWFGQPNPDYPYDKRGKLIRIRDVSSPRAFAPVGDVLDRILAADDTAAKTLRPAQVP